MLFRLSSIVFGLLILALQAPATTLERLSLEEMAAKSHIIVRATVLGQAATQRGTLVYTNYSIKVTEKLKGDAGATLIVSVPGGTIGRVRQSFAGTPTMKSGAEYVVFIWKGKSGILHIIGLSQGLFDLKLNQAGEVVLTRGVLDAQLVDRTGKEVQSQSLELTLDRLRRMVRSTEGAVR
jgi:hypothetical protein